MYFDLVLCNVVFLIGPCFALYYIQFLQFIFHIPTVYISTVYTYIIVNSYSLYSRKRRNYKKYRLRTSFFSTHQCTWFVTAHDLIRRSKRYLSLPCERTREQLHGVLQNVLPSQTTSSRWQVDKEAIGLSRVQQFSHQCVARPYQISVNSIFKHIHTTSINTII